MTEPRGEKKAVTIFSSLIGKAEKAALQLERKDQKVKVGVAKLKEKLGKTFRKVEKKATCDAYEKFKRFERLNEMLLADHTIELGESLLS